MKLIYVNPIINASEELNINYPNIDYVYFRQIKPYKNDADLVNILNDIISILDCSIIYSSGRLINTNNFIYKSKLSDYYFYLTKLNNQFIYNEYIDKLIDIHIKNIIFEYNNPIQSKTKNKTKTKKTKEKLVNKYNKIVTRDLFTNEKMYIYENPKTGDKFESKDPTLLDSLNNKPKKEKVKQNKVVSCNINFKFKIKK